MSSMQQQWDESSCEGLLHLVGIALTIDNYFPI